MKPAQRPRVSVERSGVWKSLGALAHAGAVVAVGIVAVTWASLPDRVPHVYDYPVRITEANAARQYGPAVDLITLLRLEMAWMFAGLTWGAVKVAQGEMEGLGVSLLVFWLAAIVATMAVYIVLAVRGK